MPRGSRRPGIVRRRRPSRIPDATPGEPKCPRRHHAHAEPESGQAQRSAAGVETTHDVVATVAETGHVKTLGTAIEAAGLTATLEGTGSPSATQAPPNARFRFEVVESFDARYAGDTPGHVGRGGGAAGHPQVALGDEVHRAGAGAGANDAIGVVTGVTWDRLKQSLTVEFRPKGTDRIAVGDDVWLDVGPEAGAKPPEARLP